MISRVEGGDSHGGFRRIDFSSIAFPSDALSIGALRQLHPELFDIGFGPGKEAQPLFFLNPGIEGEEVGNLLYCEREVVAHAYARFLGITRPISDVADVRGELAQYYVRYGIAAGTHQANELIRGLESQGELLGKQRQR